MSTTSTGKVEAVNDQIVGQGSKMDNCQMESRDIDRTRGGREFVVRLRLESESQQVISVIGWRGVAANVKQRKYFRVKRKEGWAGGLAGSGHHCSTAPIQSCIVMDDDKDMYSRHT